MKEHFVSRDRCELCGTETHDILYSADFCDDYLWSFLDRYYEGRIGKADLAGGKYELRKCSKCGFIWQSHVLNELFMDRLYNEWTSAEASLKKKEGAGIALFSGYARQMETIAALFPKKPSEIDVLDFGMGWGFWCRMADAFGFKVMGFELSQLRIEYARRHRIFVLENLQDIEQHRFDFINADQVFEHLPKPSEVFRALGATLKEGGIIHVRSPDGRRIERQIKKKTWRPKKDAVQPLEHINCFSHRTLSTLAQRASLDAIRPPTVVGPHRSFLRSFLGGWWNRCFGTSFYFKKKAGSR